ncbi:MAG: glycosyltransferase family 2 protein [Candidatus Methanoperedens sp.]|nr:glycosyltransferase family 2 protein [Candidatus Methanoperedens sp.]
MLSTKIGHLPVVPKVVIIIINWNGKQDTIECLTSLKKIDYSNFEIIIVDNASTDGSIECFRETFPEVTLIGNLQNLGFSGGFNVGIQKAIERAADYVLCLNNDTILDRGFLKELVIVGEQNNDIGGLGPKEYDYSNPKKIIYAGGKIGLIRSKNYRCGEIDTGQCEKYIKTEMLCGAAIMLKTKALLNIGLFDSDYFFGSEDKDIAIRLMRSGYNIMYVPSAKFWHKRRGSTSGKIGPLNVYFYLRNYLLLVRKNYEQHEFVIALLPFIFVHIPFFILVSPDRKKCLNSIIMAIKWHIDPKSLPEDVEIVKKLR